MSVAIPCWGAVAGKGTFRPGARLRTVQAVSLIALLVAWPRVGEADAAGIAGHAIVGHAPHGAARREILVRQVEKRGEMRGRQAGDAKVHGGSPVERARSIRPPRRQDVPILAAELPLVDRSGGRQ